MNDLSKSIETFLQKNGLIDTLAAFRGESKRTSNLPTKITQPTLATIHKTIIQNDQQSQNQLRQHLQKADGKYLKRFVERIKKANNMQADHNAYSKMAQQPFFKKLVEKQQQLYQKYKENHLQSINTPSYFVDEQKNVGNQWKGQSEIRLLQKERPYSEASYSNQEKVRIKLGYNIHDKMKTKLPQTVIFEQNNQPNQKDRYPLEEKNGSVLASFDMKIIYDRQKTGFQQERQMPIVINQVLAGRYQIISLLGQGRFSKAIQIKDLTSSNLKQRYCLKLILNNKDYMDQALDQIKLLKYIKANCNPDQACILTMHDFFYHRQHMMILTEVLKDNLNDVLRQNPNYFTLPKLQAITKQILTALATLHRLHIIHNDLKPENILIKSYSNGLVKLIDVGSSIFFHDNPQFEAQPISYRAPEIILGCPYNEKIDIWSLGCIVAELYNKQPLFESDNADGILIKIKGMTNLKSKIKSNNKTFLDFLSKCLKIDPTARISAKQGLTHSFITETITDE